MGIKREVVEQEMRKVVSEFINCEPSELNLEQKLRDEYGISSIEAAEMILEMEDRYHLNIPIEQARNISTTRDAVDYVLRNIK